jgi:hypothetical protein
MTQATNANDGNLGTLGQASCDEGREHGDTCTEKGAGVGGGDLSRDLESEVLRNLDVAAKAARLGVI